MYNYYVNGKWEKSKNAKIPFDDVGFLYGDGLFETMRFDNRKIFSPLKHITRLQKGLEIINLKINYNQNSLLDLLNTVIEKNNLDDGIIRLMITRGDTNNIEEMPSKTCRGFISPRRKISNYTIYSGNKIHELYR